jgi:hypothetical protein
MKSPFAVLAAILAHAVLIGLLMGMSRSPVVGVVLPLLLGLGGYRILDALIGVTPKEAKAPIPWTSTLGWMVALWSVFVIVSVFAGIALRNGAIRLGPPRVVTLSLIRLDQQPINRVPELTLIAAYYDRLEMSLEQRRALARSLSDTTLETKTLLSSLQELFANGGTPPAASPSGYEIFQFHREEGR